MIEKILESKILKEMAIINPKGCKNSSIQIEVEQRDEGPIPHMHIYLDKTRNPKNCAYVRLDKAEYVEFHDSTSMKKEQKKTLIKLLEETVEDQYIKSITSDEIKPMTWYENAVRTWIETFGESDLFKYDDNGFLIMPNYKEL